MDSTLPLYRQLTSRLFLLFLSFMVLFSVGFSFYLQYEQDLTQLKYKQLPAIEQFNQRQQLLIKSDRLLTGIINGKYANTFADDYLTLNANIKNISDLSRNNRRLLEQLIQRLKAQSENVTLLTENERRNIQLKDNVIIQLTLITDSLANIIAEQSVEQNTLHRQINQEKSSTRIMVNRVKAYSILLTKIKIDHELHQSLIDTLVMFNRLDLQYDLIEFDYITLKNQRDINNWLDAAAAVVSINPNENALLEQVVILNALLFDEQNTLAKWRGQLRMAIDLQTELSKQKMELAPLLDKALVVQPLKSSIIEQKLLSWLTMANINLQPKYYIWLITCTFLIITLIFISLLISLRRKIKHAGLQGIAVVDELVATGKVSTPIPGLEVTAIVSRIEQLAKPLHSEVDFQLQQQQFKTHNALMSRHTGNVYWQLPLGSKKLQRKLIALLAVESSDKHWRNFFSRADVRLILTSARAAKNNQCIEKIKLTSNQGKAIALSIEYIDSTWCGSVQNIEEYRLLKDENSQLHQQVKQQNQIDKLAIIANSEDVLGITSNVMAEKQKRSLTPDDEHQVYQQLQQLINWSEQQRTCAQLRRDDFVLSLSTVSLVNEVHTALANVSFSQAQNNNRIYVRMDENLVNLVTLESELFQAMLTTICRKMFTEQYLSELDVDLSVIDVNSAQQKVRISFTIKQTSQLQSLQRVINELAFNEDVTATYDNATDNYLRDLQLVFNVSNKVCQSLDDGGKFSFDMSFAIAEDLHQNSNDKVIKLAKRSLLVIATEKPIRERICQALSNSKAVVETMQNVLLFQRQISIKHLTKHPIDVIILSSEVYLTDYDLITQHLASLPSKLQSKILVLQPYDCETLQRTGLFSSCNLPWFSETLIVEVQQLIQGDSKTNLLVEPEIFSPYRFVPSQVEVLVGVEEAKSNQILIRTLHWLGLQVTLVSQSEQLERLWQSGRFLLVISEFSDFNMDINKSVSAQRGVFILNPNLARKADVMLTNNAPNTLLNDDEITYLAPVLDFQKLAEQLSPWLISAINESTEKQTQVTSSKHTKSSSMNLKVDSLPVEPQASNADIEQPFDFELVTKHQQISEITSNAFDLNQYAQNQGSAELAAFMLDDYLADITVNSQDFITAIDEQNVELAKQKLVLLAKLAKVIAAKPLILQCEELSQTLKNYSGDSTVSAKLGDEIHQQLHHLKQCIVELTEFAETI